MRCQPDPGQTPDYDTNGELASVTYSNGSSLANVGRGAAGRLTGLTWKTSDAATTAVSVRRTRAGTIFDETLPGDVGNPAGPDYSYDDAGRLTDAWVRGHHFDYDFTSSAPASCPAGTAAAAGANGNRMKMTDTVGATTTTTGYCYDSADRLLATTGAAPITGIVVLWLELAERRRVTSEDETLLTVLAGRLGQGLSRVHRQDQQRETALALQHAILGPQELPGGFAVRYQPATRPLQVGGDWYDLVDLDGGRIALVVGDCVGHGLAAATVMGQLRSACRALLLEHPTPAAALTALDRFAARLPGAGCTTAFCAVLTPETGELAYSSAGHPPPVLVHADRTIQLLEDGHSIPLGVRVEHTRPEARIVIPPRATLLLYTDGLVERRRHPLDEGIARVAALLETSATATPEELADLVMTELAPAAGYEDDVAVLLYRQPGPLAIDFPADAGQLAPTRKALRGWLGRCGLDPDQIQNVLVAAGEAVANSIEHGHRDSPGGAVRLSATAFADRLHVTVADTGVWKTPQPSANSRRGRGMTMMRELVSDVSVHPTADGTTVHLHARITP